MSKTRKKELAVIIIGGVLLAAAFASDKLMPGLQWYWRLALYLVPYLVLGLSVLIEAVHGIIGGEFLDENFLMAAASIGALSIGEGPEGVLVMLLYRIGEFLQELAVGKSRDSVTALMDICPDSVNLETEHGFETVTPEEAHIGDIFIVRPGERIPLDGMIIEGSSGLNTSALTGESMPVDVGTGDRIKSGCINLNGVLRVRVECEYEDSTAARMLELIEGAAANKSQSEKFITKFAHWYTPIVVGLAVLLAILPPILFHGEWKDWIYRALNFLVISCPCALVISVPLTFFGGIGAASRKGILIKGSNCLESLANCGTVVFDKTGTLTSGTFSIEHLYEAAGFDRNELLRYTAAAEQFSTHPLAVPVLEAYAREFGADSIPETLDHEELAGRGVRAVVDGKTVFAGNLRLMSENGIETAEEDADLTAGSVIYTAVAGRYAGCIVIADSEKHGAGSAVAELRSIHKVKTVMLTGDRRIIGEHVAEKLGIDEAYTELLPEDKVRHVERLIAENSGKRTTAFVGDGINDAPVIARADVGFAMGGLGSDAAIEAADIVLMDDKVKKVPLAIDIAKRTVRIARENTIFAIAVKLAVLILGALGYAEMWMAIIADVGVCLIAVLNAMRAMHIKEN